MGTRNPQKKASFDHGYRALRSKYVQATSSLAQQLKTPELPKVEKEYQSEFTTCVNAYFAQQMSVTHTDVSKEGFQRVWRTCYSGNDE